MKNMTEKEQYIADFKANNPIRDCLGCGPRFKWVRYLDGIDLRYGHNSRKSAEMARAKSARESWAMYELGQQSEICHCGGISNHQTIDALGECITCSERRYP